MKETTMNTRKRRSSRATDCMRLLAVVVGVVLVAGCSKDSSPETAAVTTEVVTTDPGTTDAATTIETAAAKSMPGMMVYELPAPEHVDGKVSYPQNPPVGGDHNPAWQNCGAYDEAVQNETAVHSMEHGAVWITYRPDLADTDVAVLRALAVNQTHLLVSPYPGQLSPVVVTAWGHQLALDNVNDARLGAFIAAYQEGPETPEPGAPCSGAIGEPL